ncbi:ribonuclease H-like domain-containing protein [candidate division KSB1 bacterium]|nr:ribonuclease H-like domain-containing protein [candidate division KSB1 bacterium]
MNISSIKQKLRELDAINTITSAPAKEPRSLSLTDIEKIGARLATNHYGDCIVREKHFPLDHVHGVKIADFLDMQEYLPVAARLPELKNCSPRDLVFIDTETTGLAGGTGTYIFLVGVGSFQGDAFVVQQFFLSDYKDEPAFLNEIAELVKSAAGLVSFNGKSYDIPLLRTRFVLNRLPSVFEDKPHIDLLHPSRRLWRKFLPSCNLGMLEQFVLKFRRQGDIPGAEIPALFFEFLREKNVVPLKPVFQHNVMDVLSLVSLGVKIARILACPDYEDEIPFDLLGKVKNFSDLGLWEKASVVCSSATHQADDEATLNLLQWHALLLKKQQRFEQAERVWIELIDRSVKFILDPYVELAKYYEHQTGDYTQALDYVNRAIHRLEIAQELSGEEKSPDIRRQLLHRKQRLTGKLNRSLQ